MIDKNIYNGIKSVDRDLNIFLSAFNLIASSVGIFLIASSKSGLTGFSVFEFDTIGGIGVGIVFFVILLAAIIVTLINLSGLFKKH